MLKYIQDNGLAKFWYLQDDISYKTDYKNNENSILNLLAEYGNAISQLQALWKLEIITDQDIDNITGVNLNGESID